MSYTVRGVEHHPIPHDSMWIPWAIGDTDVPPAVAWEPNWAANGELGNLSDQDLNVVLGFKAFIREYGAPAALAAVGADVQEGQEGQG